MIVLPALWLALYLTINTKPKPYSKLNMMNWPGQFILTETTLNNGYLGSRNDEERSEMRYVV